MKRTLQISALFALACLAGGALLLQWLAAIGEAPPPPLFWLATGMLALLAVQSIRFLATLEGARLLTAALFGVWVLYFWQLLVLALEVPKVLLSPPSLIAQSIAMHWPTLWDDFVQTVLKAVLIGWALGSGLGFAVAVAIDRLPFLQRGLLPLASLSSTIPLVAPSWPSFLVRPRRAWAFGFRISTEAARMNMPLVWAAIAVAAVTGSVAYAVLVQLERRAAFWHPSVREG